jgi:hypothetical protein
LLRPINDRKLRKKTGVRMCKSSLEHSLALNGFIDTSVGLEIAEWTLTFCFLSAILSRAGNEAIPASLGRRWTRLVIKQKVVDLLRATPPEKEGELWPTSVIGSARSAKDGDAATGMNKRIWCEICRRMRELLFDVPMSPIHLRSWMADTT